MSSSSGILWIVATPLGNPGDLSPRARETLGGVDGILAEDTRRTGLLLARCGILAPPLTSLHDHNEDDRLSRVLAWLREGKSLALVSDAGTPLLSDPGFRLVRACREAGISVSPVPGPSAPLAALSACGLPPHPFVFLGFVPRKQAERRSLFTEFAGVNATLVFFERKDRLRSCLADAQLCLGSREGCIARELTKTHEEFIYFSLDEYGRIPEDLLGEITVVLGPPAAGGRTDSELVDRIIMEEQNEGGKTRDIVRRVQPRVSGWTAKELYQRVLGGGPGVT